MMILIKTLLLKNIIKNNKDTVYDSIGINIIATQHNVDNDNDTKNKILDIISLSSAPSFLIMTTVIQRHSREAQVMITDF